MTQQRHDGQWVVIVGMRGAPVMLGSPHSTEDDANRSIGHFWGSVQREAHIALIGPESPADGPI